MLLIFVLNNLFVTQSKAYPDINCIEWFGKSKISKNQMIANRIVLY